MISGRVVKKEIDSNGNIRVETEYTLTDGSKQLGHTRYTWSNFTPENVERDIKSQCDNLMSKVYALKTNQELVNSVDLSKINVEVNSVEVTTTPAVRDISGIVITPATTITIDDK